MEEKASENRLEEAALVLDVMLKRSWRYWVEFAVIVSQRHGVKDLGHKLLQLKSDLESTAGEKLNRTWQCFVGVTDC